MLFELQLQHGNLGSVLAHRHRTLLKVARYVHSSLSSILLSSRYGVYLLIVVLIEDDVSTLPRTETPNMSSISRQTPNFSLAVGSDTTNVAHV